MPVKQWFYKHPNISFVSLITLGVIYGAIATYYLSNQRWGFAALNAVVALFFNRVSYSWWKNEVDEDG